MSDGTIEEDFEEALAREIEAGTGGGSLASPGKLNKSFLKFTSGYYWLLF